MKLPTPLSPTQRLTLTALAAAAVFAATFFLRLPTPVGYIHAGDGVIFLAAAFLGPVGGALAGALGASVADLAGGFAVYAPVTALVKALAGVTVGLLTKKKTSIPGFVLVCFLAGLFTVVGYFLYECFLYGRAVALVTLLPNAVQVLFGVLVAAVGRWKTNA